MNGIYDGCHLAGGMTPDYWERDPKRLAFVLARYKFVARMLEGKEIVLEVGCADGFGSRIVRQHVGFLTAVDIDPASIEEAKARQSKAWPVDFNVHDLLSAPLPGFSAAYCLDVLEHILAADEAAFILNLRRSAPIAIVGMPSLESQAYASELSRQGHVNCKSGPDLKRAMERYFASVFMFSMSDETVHTGFQPMAHYLMALCVA
jgi:hypothetical protein